MARLTIEFFNSLDLSGDVVHTQTVERLHAMWFGEVGPDVNPGEFSARLIGTVTPPASGDIHLCLDQRRRQPPVHRRRAGA